MNLNKINPPHTAVFYGYEVSGPIESYTNW